LIVAPASQGSGGGIVGDASAALTKPKSMNFSSP
jgi:hypothetical protein